MAMISGNATIAGIDVYQQETVASSPLGQLIFGDNGKAFRYVKAGGTLVVGNILQAPVIDTQFDSMSVPANAVGLQTVTITNGTTALTGGEFIGGSLSVSVAPGLGEEYTILGNGAAISGASLTVYLDRPIRTAWTTSTKVTLRNLWNGVIQCPTTLTGSVAGVAVSAIASGSYGWIQTKGVAGVLSDNSTGAVGSDVGVPGATAGSVGVNVAGTGKCNTVGRALRALASGVVVPVYLVLD